MTSTPENARGPAPSGPIRILGVLGAGRLGATLARKAVEAGYRVLVAASGPPETIAPMIGIVAPGAEPVTAAEAIAEADAVVLAVPYLKRDRLPLAQLDGTLVIDAMNYWPATDGTDPEVENSPLGTSELLLAHLPSGVRLVKALNTVGYHELDLDARPKGAGDRKAIALAGDDPEAVAAVSCLIDDLGFDPVDAGPLAHGRLLEPGTEVFGAGMNAEQTSSYLRARLPDSARRRLVPTNVRATQ
ncbi:NADPH-dependent F420 reductase [uncultured Aeromicrobium sp.]|uniref:NADPH-dependent F420 reductase n=1 Tax=uncultured Aeromicrobium sp. TaxID=337820 RepID=UPI0025ECD3E5|nr:NAD(P)-binding domain-containing protein [uncultured Aeromicrobium sp.]